MSKPEAPCDNPACPWFRDYDGPCPCICHSEKPEAPASREEVQCGFCRHEKSKHFDGDKGQWCNGYHDDGVGVGTPCYCDGFALSMDADPYSGKRGARFRVATE